MSTRQNIRHWVPFGILLGAIVVLFHDLLLGNTLFWGLPSLQFYPWRWFAFEEISSGRIPYWNPYNGAGTPLLANYQSAILYPPNWLHLILPEAYTMSLVALLHVLWAGFGMWKFAGQLDMSPLGRGVSMLCFALGTYTIGRLGSFPTAQSIAWIPWLFWALSMLFTKRTYSSIGLLGLFSGLQLLAGHAQSTWYGLLALGIFALWYVIWQMRKSGLLQRLELLVLAASGLLLGAGLAAWQLYLTAQFLLESQRSGGVSFETLTNFSYAPARIIGLFMPNFFGSPVDGSYLTPERGVYFEDANYIGVLPLISVAFAIYGWFKWRTLLTHHRVFRSVPLWVFISIVGFVLALGRFGPVYRFLYDYIPTFDNFREPVRWLLWPAFGLSILAGIGVHYWSQSKRALFWTRLGAAAGAGGAFVSLAAIVTTGNDAPNADLIQTMGTAMIAVGCWIFGAAILTLRKPSATPAQSTALWQMAVLIFVAADLAWAGAGLNPTAPDDFYSREFSISTPRERLYWWSNYEEEVKFDTYFDLADYRVATDRWTNVRTSLLPNINMLDRVPLLNNFDPLQVGVHRQYIDLIEEAGPEAGSLLRAAGVTQTYGTILPEGWNVGRTETIALAPAPADTVWVVPAALAVESTTAAKDALRDPTWNPEQTVILLTTDDLTTTTPTPNVSTVRILSDTSTERQYSVTTETAGYLVLATTYYPGWQARVDGEIVQIHQANLAFMAIAVPAGNTEITLQYTPPGAAAAAVITLLSLFIIVSLIATGLLGTNDA
jgi:hypothetical protein